MVCDFIDEKEVDAMRLGRARPPYRAGRSKRSLTISLMLSRPVMEGMIWSLVAILMWHEE